MEMMMKAKYFENGLALLAALFILIGVSVEVHGGDQRRRAATDVATDVSPFGWIQIEALETFAGHPIVDRIGLTARAVRRRAVTRR